MAISRREAQSKARSSLKKPAALAAAGAVLTLSLRFIFMSESNAFTKLFGIPLAMLWILGLLLLLICLSLGAVALVLIILDWLRKPKRSFQLALHTVSQADLATIQQLGLTNLPDFLTLQELQLLHQNCNSGFVSWIDTAGSIQGFAILVPLLKRAVDNILAVKIRTAHQLQQRDFARSFRQATGVYIAVVVAAQKQHRNEVAYYLGELVGKLVQYRSVRYVFARPISPESVRMARRRGFQPIHEEDSGPIWKAKVVD